MEKGVRTIKVVKLHINVTERDITEGECELPNQCMIRVAVERTLRRLDPKATNHHSRVDAGHIRWNLDGHRYSGDTPKIAKASLIRFDRESKARSKARRLGTPFKTQIEPFSFTLVGTQGSKVQPMTRERQIQINDARKRRIEAGQKQKQYSFRKRVIGFA